MTDYPTDGTVADVTTWIGDDATRAQQALDVENASDHPRKGVLDAADRVLAAAAPAERIAATTSTRPRQVTFRHPDGRIRTVSEGSSMERRYAGLSEWVRQD